MPNPPISSIEWRRVSGKYLWAQLVSVFIGLLMFSTIPLVLVLAGMPWFGWVWTLIPVVIMIGVLIATPFQVRAIGWALREDDFLLTSGVLFRRTVAVPYGRMQLVDVKQGPVLRMLGLASLHLVTAAIATQASVPGLTREDADRLRDHLVRVAETRRAGV